MTDLSQKRTDLDLVEGTRSKGDRQRTFLLYDHLVLDAHGAWVLRGNLVITLDLVLSAQIDLERELKIVANLHGRSDHKIPDSVHLLGHADNVELFNVIDEEPLTRKIVQIDLKHRGLLVTDSVLYQDLEEHLPRFIHLELEVFPPENRPWFDQLKLKLVDVFKPWVV